MISPLNEQNISESSFSNGEYSGEFTYSSFSEFVSEKNIVSYNFNIARGRAEGRDADPLPASVCVGRVGN